MTYSRDTADHINEVPAIESKLDNGQNRGKNLIINGDFSVWQRGTSGFTTDGYTADRWRMDESGATVTVSQQPHVLGQTDVPGNPQHFLRYDVATGNADATFSTRVENVSSVSGSEVTLSFYAKGSNPGGGNLSLDWLQYFGTGGSPSSFVTGNIGTTTLTSSWQKFTYTFTPTSISGKTLGTNGDDYISFSLKQPSADATTSAWQLDISNVQLEFGDTATDFEYVSPADQLARCQRYFERQNIMSGAIFTVGQAVSTSQVESFITYTEKRAIPSISDNGNVDVLNSTGGNAGGSTAYLTPSKSNSFVRQTGATGLAAGNASTLFAGGGAVTIDIDAEL